MRRRAVEIEVKFLYILAVIALRIRQPEEPFLDDRIVPVPDASDTHQSSGSLPNPAMPSSPQRYMRLRA